MQRWWGMQSTCSPLSNICKVMARSLNKKSWLSVLLSARSIRKKFKSSHYGNRGRYLFRMCCEIWERQNGTLRSRKFVNVNCSTSLCFLDFQTRLVALEVATGSATWYSHSYTYHSHCCQKRVLRGTNPEEAKSIYCCLNHKDQSDKPWCIFLLIAAYHKGRETKKKARMGIQF